MRALCCGERTSRGRRVGRPPTHCACLQALASSQARVRAEYVSPDRRWGCRVGFWKAGRGEAMLINEIKYPWDKESAIPTEQRWTQARGVVFDSVSQYPPKQATTEHRKEKTRMDLKVLEAEKSHQIKPTSLTIHPPGQGSNRIVPPRHRKNLGTVSLNHWPEALERRTVQAPHHSSSSHSAPSRNQEKPEISGSDGT